MSNSTHPNASDNIFRAFKDLEFKSTISHQCVEGRAIADLMATKPGITVTYMPSMIRIDGEGRIEFKMDEIGDELGREMTAPLFEISTSTHYGRMVMVDENTVVLFGNMEEAMAFE
ncbi:MmoB/DmpM family protein [Roseateles sp. GG27B]